MTNRTLTRDHANLHMRFPAADGLKKGDAVLLRGVQVGEVRSLSFAEEGGVIVRARLTERVALKQDAAVALVAADIFGRQSVVLRRGSSLTPLLASDTIPGSAPVSLTAKMEDLGASAGRLLGDSTITLLRDALSGVNEATVEVAGLTGVARSAIERQQQGLEAATREVARLASNLSDATAPEDMARIRGDLERSIGRMSQLTEKLDTTASSANRVLARLESGEGSAARLLNDTALFDGMVAVMGSAEALLSDIRRNPRRYVKVSVF
jgi:phospholipid/cholesterol/gamma-HCH transport system substrate-binding protein